jgi:hypothetical protein
MDQTRNVDISPAERSRLRVSRGKRTLRSSRRGHRPGTAGPGLSADRHLAGGAPLKRLTRPVRYGGRALFADHSFLTGPWFLITLSAIAGGIGDP